MIVPVTPAKSVRQALVVEDDAQVRLAVAAILHLQGFQVSTSAGPVEEALDTVRQGPPDMLVFDVALTGMAGLRVISRIHLAAPDAVVVVLTGIEGLRDAALKAGAAHVIGLRDLRHLADCVQNPATVTACDCCVIAETENTSSPALTSGWFRLSSGPALPVQIGHPGNEQATASTEVSRRTGE